MLRKRFIHKLMGMLVIAIIASGCSMLQVSQPYGTGSLIGHNIARAVSQPVRASVNNVSCNDTKMSYFSGWKLIAQIPVDIAYGIADMIIPVTPKMYHNIDGDELMKAWSLYENDIVLHHKNEGSKYIIVFKYTLNGGQEMTSKIQFINRAYADKFWANWQKYLPQYGGYCAYSYPHLLLRPGYQQFYRIYQENEHDPKIYFFNTELNQEFWSYTPHHLINDARQNGFPDFKWQEVSYFMMRPNQAKILIDHKCNMH